MMLKVLRIQFFVGIILVSLGSCRFMGICLDEASCKKYESDFSALDCEAGVLLGTWQKEGRRITFGTNCRFSADECGLRGVYEARSEMSGSFQMDVDAFNADATSCLAGGPQPMALECTYNRSSLSLNINCSDVNDKNFINETSMSRL